MTFQYERPHSLPEALAALEQHGDEAKVLAGGTAVVLMLRQGLIAPRVLIDIGRLPGLDQISDEPDGLHIGPLVLLRQVESSEIVGRRYPALAHACAEVGNVRVRNQATLGGNLAEADYASDPPAMLLALAACVTVASASGSRQIPLTEFFRGFYATALNHTELITGITIPGRAAMYTTYLKFQMRSAQDRPCLGVAAVAAMEDGICTDLRVAIGAACEVPRRLPEVEALAVGHDLGDELIAEIAGGYSSGIDTLDDLRGSAWYRTEMIRVHVRRALEDLRDAVG